ncbi:MAG: APC family permease [Verrucomicrobiota bacterium]
MPTELRRDLGVVGAALIGLGSILGTGVFVVIGLGVAEIGSAILPAILVGGLVATCNGLNSAQLAANFPIAGGTYEYGYRLLTPAHGFTAGWMFLLAKSASAATAALAIGRTLGGAEWMVPLALAVIVIMTLIIVGGLKRTNTVNAVIIAVTLLALLWFSALGLGSSAPIVRQPCSFGQFLEMCALVFVGYTGYGRIATMGEEIKQPRKNIPTAMILTLAASAVLYAGVAWAELKGVGYPVIWRIGEVTALLGVLLNLILGLSRILFAMGRRADMPALFGAVTTASQPRNAVLGVVVLIALLILLGDIKLAWSFSAFTVLIYYAICNLAALQLNAKQRLYSRGLGYLGLVSCLFLAFWVDWKVWLVGLLMIGLGLFWLRQRKQAIFQRLRDE